MYAGTHRAPKRSSHIARRIVLVGLALIIAITGMVAFASAANAPTQERYAACPTEDSAGPCYWDARHHGNGKGRSFLVHADQSIEFTSLEGIRK